MNGEEGLDGLESVPRPRPLHPRVVSLGGDDDLRRATRQRAVLDGPEQVGVETTPL